MHDGSLGFFVQSIGGAVPDVQLPATHVDPELFPSDVVVVCSYRRYYENTGVARNYKPF